jgi:mono/diheme cytochrome c family protein
VTEEVVRRGRERYDIFCAMCHGPVGQGDGMIVRRGYRQPPSYHEDRLRRAPVGYFFRVMTEGFGAMPPYKSQVPVQDRWAIAAYVRALQLSQTNLHAAPAAAAPAAGQPQTGGHE